MMEPLAPGTEDDVENSLVATNSKKVRRLFDIYIYAVLHSTSMYVLIDMLECR